ncbi:hypothetical protein SNA_15165 [Streptomyces natalensis ATCC 27448]|uniref:Uncharacterized protein n=1 Tax=Streptomyces natalensis ATCC 27448 TaxID=1240678 RepID=A0A0D7CMA1_9ACTN|nr:hypothetical protein SNA_15165 [Streptomyces natalensis ATCC 27448]
MGSQAALSWAQRGVQVYEELAGLRPAGSTTPVNYENLAAFTPNTYWWDPSTGGLASALWFLALAYREANNDAAAATILIQRVRLAERLAGADPNTYKSLLGSILVHQFIGDAKWRAELGSQAALSWAQRGVQVYEELAGLRPAGSTTPVNYENLAAFTPNTYWWDPSTGGLASALWFLALAYREANNDAAAATILIQRVRLAERLAGADPNTYKSLLVHARADAAAFGFRPRL